MKDMVHSVLSTSQEHPLDVLASCVRWQDAGLSVALAMLTNTSGGAVRAPGALMAVAENGETFGYLSGGCIDADIALQAAASLKTNETQTVRYGTGSPFMDIQLPCGGAIDVTLFPTPSKTELKSAIESLQARNATDFILADKTHHYTAHYRPKLKLRLAGRGHDPLVLARIALSAGIITELWSNESECLQAAQAIEGLRPPVTLSMPDSLPAINDDTSTAFVLMMHDPDWETDLLASALKGRAFYIGAVGSPRTHARRSEHLRKAGVSDADIARIHGPIGLVPSLRDASMLAISTLAEIIAAYRTDASTLTTTPIEMALTHA